MFAVAGDAPFVDAAFIDRLRRSIATGRRGDRRRAATTATATQIEPLAALYAREAFLREGLPLISGERRDRMRVVIDRLRTRYVDVRRAKRLFANVNTPG